MNILLVEDDAEMRQLLQSALELRGHAVTAVADGESGWARYQDRDFPLVILDWLLPGIDGLEVCRRMRKTPQGADSVILVITVRTLPGDLEQVLAAGADDYLAKPVDAGLLDIRLTIAERRVYGRRRRRDAEEALRAAHAASLAIEERFTLLAETIDEVFWMADPEIPRMAYVSPAYERVWGRSQQSLYDDPRSFIEAIHPQDRQQALAVFAAKKIGQAFDHEYRIVRPDGSIHWIWDRGYPVQSIAGKVGLYAGVATDITGHKQIEQSLVVARDDAERASRVKSEFLARMSHELRTPLNAILGFAQVMEATGDDETMGAYREECKTIVRSGWHLLRIIEDLLNLSSIETNKIQLNLEAVDVRNCVNESFDILSPLANDRRIGLDCADDGCDGLIVWTDAFRLKQILINLLANAVKYNRDGGSVTVSGLRIPGRIRILISDTGQGIPEDELPSIFEPFSRLVERPYHIEGAGIGLSITKQLTELMGGAIGVESAQGKGSTFWIELPAAAVPVAANSVMTPPRDDKAAGKQQLLLYIEDNPEHVDLVKAIVSKMANLSVVAAHTPHLGLDLAAARRPDLILVDICLPEMDGYELLKRFQTDEGTRDIPVIATSATAQPAEIQRGLRAGFRRYLTKPLNVAGFRKAIEELLHDAAS